MMKIKKKYIQKIVLELISHIDQTHISIVAYAIGNSISIIDTPSIRTIHFLCIDNKNTHFRN